MENKIIKLQYKYRKDGLSVKGLANDYAVGFVEGLREQFEEQKKKHQEWGLVLVKDKEVIEAYKHKEFDGSVNTSINFKGHKDIYYIGHEDGQNFSISDKIAEGEEDTITELLR